MLLEVGKVALAIYILCLGSCPAILWTFWGCHLVGSVWAQILVYELLKGKTVNGESWKVKLSIGSTSACESSWIRNFETCTSSDSVHKILSYFLRFCKSKDSTNAALLRDFLRLWLYVAFKCFESSRIETKLPCKTTSTFETFIFEHETTGCDLVHVRNAKPCKRSCSDLFKRCACFWSATVISFDLKYNPLFSFFCGALDVFISKGFTDLRPHHGQLCEWKNAWCRAPLGAASATHQLQA